VEGAGVVSWSTGSESIRELLEHGELEAVEPSVWGAEI